MIIQRENSTKIKSKQKIVETAQSYGWNLKRAVPGRRAAYKYNITGVILRV